MNKKLQDKGLMAFGKHSTCGVFILMMEGGSCPRYLKVVDENISLGRFRGNSYRQNKAIWQRQKLEILNYE